MENEIIETMDQENAANDTTAAVHEEKAGASCEKIAEAGSVSVSTCSNLFSRLIHRSPVSYLLTYRLHEAQKLLRQTDLSITEAASASGFNGSSYFAEIFRRETGMTPGQCRTESRQQGNG